MKIKTLDLSEQECNVLIELMRLGVKAVNGPAMDDAMRSYLHFLDKIARAHALELAPQTVETVQEVKTESTAA
jgi:hypothetical protein